MPKKREDRKARTQPQEQPDQQETGRKEKKVKVVYYDDGSTIADMSGTRKQSSRPKTTFREKMRTFVAVMRRMVLPMLCTLAAFTIIYLIVLAAAGKLG